MMDLLTPRAPSPLRFSRLSIPLRSWTVATGVACLLGSGLLFGQVRSTPIPQPPSYASPSLAPGGSPTAGRPVAPVPSLIGPPGGSDPATLTTNTRPPATMPQGIPPTASRAQTPSGDAERGLDPQAAPADPSAVADARTLSRAFRGAAAQVSPAVVTVVGRVESPYPMGRSGRPGSAPRDLQTLPPREPGPPSESLVEASVGSGVIISPSGHVLTNTHVVRGSQQVLVRLEDGREFVATEVKTDPLSDVAVLRIAAERPLPFARLGDSEALDIGDWVLAIGHPFELDLTVSAGIISGKGRSISKIRRGALLQTDAAINPGNSGGPLVNLDGEVIGLNTAIASSNGGSQGIGFAIPSNRAAWVVKELLTHGEVRRSYLGIYIDEVDAAMAARLNLPVRGGVLVTGTREDGPAARAGLTKGDLITSFAGKTVRAPQELQDAVEQYPVGSEHPVRFVRDGRTYSANVMLDPLPASGG